MAKAPKKAPKKGRKANLKPPWKKGQSGNPKGKVKEPEELKDFKKFCKEKCKEMGFQKKVLKMAEKHPKVLELILHYGIGKPKDTIAFEGDLKPIILPATATEEEYAEIIEKYKRGKSE